MRRPLSITSITIDEAVSILLGWSTGPIEFKSKDRVEDAEEFESIDEAEEAEENRPTFDLRETLDDEREVLDGEYRMAEFEKQPAHVIAEKLAALQQHEAVIERANSHLCAIEDELNKGEQSALKVDRARTNAAYTYITLHSFDEWVERRASVSAGASDAEAPSASSAAPPAAATQRVHRTKGRDRRDAIVAEIVNRNLDPMALPVGPSGKDGLRKEIRDALQALPLFQGRPKVFNRAWADLFHKDDGRLAYKAKDPPPNS